MLCYYYHNLKLGTNNKMINIDYFKRYEIDGLIFKITSIDYTQDELVHASKITITFEKDIIYKGKVYISISHPDNNIIFDEITIIPSAEELKPTSCIGFGETLDNYLKLIQEYCSKIKFENKY